MSVDDPLDRARALVLSVPRAARELRLVGGLAVRSCVGDLARASVDVDLVAMTDAARDATIAHLRAEGFRVGESGGWWRCLRETRGREVVDIGCHPVVNPRTFDTIELRADPIEDGNLVVVGVDDLAYMKLCAGRDQDLVDLVLLASHRPPDARAIARAARADDVERLVARTVLEAQFSTTRGLLEPIYEEALARSIKPSEREAFEELLRRLQEEA